MYCRNCGQKLKAEDKFCGSCGEKTILANESDKKEEILTAAGVETPQVETTEKKEDPLFEPFNFETLDFEKELGVESAAAASEKEELSKPAPTVEEFDWGIHTFPRTQVEKTEDIDFNWSVHPEELKKAEVEKVQKAEEPVIKAEEKIEKIPEEKPEVFTPSETKWQYADMVKPAEPEVKDEKPSAASSLEESLFGDLDSKADEARKQSEEIDKFFTFNKKNEEFQKLLDQEYAKIKSGNILQEEMDSAAAASEEKFASIKPEDPMEDLFASEGVVKSYEPKPVETDVLDRIEAAEAEKKAREEAARLIEEEKNKAKAEAEAKARAEAAVLAEKEAARLRLEAEAKRAADARAAQEAAEREQARAAARAEAEAAMKAAQEKAQKAREEAEAKLAQQAAMAMAKAKVEAEAKAEAEAEAKARAEEAAKQQAAAKAAEEARIAAEKDPFDHITEMARARETYFGEQTPEPVAVEDINEEAISEKTKAVDKAAILAGMATASQIVQRDKEAAAAEVSQNMQPQTEPDLVDVPDFLGHLADDEPQEPIVENIEQVEELSFEEPEAPQAEEEMSEIPADLFSIEDLLADETPQDPTKSNETMIMTDESAADILNNPAETDETIIFPADFNPAEDINEAMDEETGGKESRIADFDDEEYEEEEEEKSGKGRIVLKICLFILIILLALEVAGVAIKVAAPNSGAAKFIDTQLTKVINVFTGGDAEYSAFATAEDIRQEPAEDKTSLIKAEMGKNKDGNIGEITYDAKLKFDPEKKYDDPDLMLTQSLSEIAWYKNAENKQVYYDQAIVGAIIAYDSQKVNLINNNDPSVLNLMQKGTKLYKTVKKLGDKGKTQKFKSLQIGEIRQSGSSFYVWVSEKVTETQNGSTNNLTTKRIYELQADNETMQIVSSHNI